MQEFINNILKLVKIPSISGHQEAIYEAIDLIKSEFIPDGAYFRKFEFAGADPVLLISNCQGDEFDILTVGHIDVVPAEDKLFSPRIENGKIFARGALDMKSSVMTNLYALKYAMGKNIKFGVLITTDEETTSNGIKALVKNHPIFPKIVLDTDAGDLLTICEKAKHPVSVKIVAHGDSAHSSRPWNGVNAVSHLMKCLNELQKDFPEYEKGGQQPENIWQDTMVVTAFNSPTTYNVVPSEAEARVNFRLTEKISLEELKAKLQSACTKYNCAYEIMLCSRGVYMDINMPFIRTYKEIAESVLGQPLKVSQMCGGTDARMFSDIATIIMHSVNGENAHGENEFVEIESIGKLLEIEKKFIDNYIASHK